MKLVRLLVLGSLVASTPLVHASEADDDWKMLGGVLSIVQSLVRVAAATDDPRAMQQGMDAIFAGRNPDANRIAGDLMAEMMDDMPAQYRGTVNALARDMIVIARRENARAAAQSAVAEKERVVLEDRASTLQARKDLAAMGLRYYDAEQYREALRRNDALAVELFVAGRGLDPAILQKN